MGGILALRSRLGSLRSPISAAPPVTATCFGPGETGQSVEPRDGYPAPNQVLLGGVLVCEPERSRSAGGDPTTVLLVAFHEAGEKLHWGTSCSEVEVLDELIECQRSELHAGAICFIAGELMGSGYIWANLLAVLR